MDTIIKGLHLKRRQHPYFSFLSPDADFTDLHNQAYNIVVTDEQLQNNAIKEKLSKLFQANSNLTLILCVGDSNVYRGLLTLVESDLPSFVKHLSVRNPSGNVTTINGLFLSFYKDLTSFDISLMQATRISSQFLYGCKSLTSFNALLPQLTKIQDDCLANTGLTRFDTSWLRQVTKIGNGFLSDTGLTSFDALLPQLTKIGQRFLYGCRV